MKYQARDELFLANFYSTTWFTWEQKYRYDLFIAEPTETDRGSGWFCSNKLSCAQRIVHISDMNEDHVRNDYSHNQVVQWSLVL